MKNPTEKCVVVIADKTGEDSNGPQPDDDDPPSNTADEAKQPQQQDPQDMPSLDTTSEPNQSPRMLPTRQRRSSFDSQSSGLSTPLSRISEPCDNDFPWDSDIDGLPSQLTSDDDALSSNSEDDLYANDPWTAICVIGLRVYSMDERTSLSVVKGGSSRGRRTKCDDFVVGRARSPA